jgi:hypothetical protein
MVEMPGSERRSWHISVRGAPPEIEGDAWRAAIREATLRAYPSAPLPPPPDGTRFTVDVVFRMPAGT